MDPILPVCSNWEDVLWAYVSAVLTAKLRRAMNDYLSPTSPQLEEAWGKKKPSLYADMPFDRIFDEIRESTNYAVKLSAQRPFPNLVRAILIDDMDLAVVPNLYSYFHPRPHPLPRLPFTALLPSSSPSLFHLDPDPHLHSYLIVPALAFPLPRHIPLLFPSHSLLPSLRVLGACMRTPKPCR